MENQTLALIVKGETEFMGIKVPIIQGGFGENQKCVLAREIAKIHNKELKHINESIKALITKERIKENVHYIDLLEENSKVDVSDLEIKLSNNTKNLFLLSERGYFSLIKYMDDDMSWKVHDDFVNNYFELKEEVKEIKHYIRSNNRLTDKCLLNLEGQKEEDSDFIFLVNNAVRNETERAIDQLGIKSGVIAIKAGIRENTMSQWRTRRTTLPFDQLEKVTDVIAKFKELLD